MHSHHLAERATPPFALRVDEHALSTCVPRRRHAGGAPLGPLEAFVFSRVDGRRSIADLAVLVGLSPRELFHVISRLVDLRVVEVVHYLEPIDELT